MLERLVFDVRHAARSLRRRPAYTISSIATLALVIGVNAALFAAINATLFRPVGLKSGDRTVTVFTMPPGLSDPKYRNPFHQIDLVRFRERSRTLTHIAGFTQQDRVLGAGDEPTVLATAPVSAELLRLSPEGPILGRTFTDEEETRQEHLIVLSYGAWQARFGGDASVIGRRVELDAEPYIVIGVMPQSFPPKAFAADLWTPLGIRTTAPDDARTYIVPVAELSAGATLAQADAEARAILADLARELPKSHQGWTGGVLSYREWQYGGFRTPLVVLFLAVTVLLLIASSNIASLTLAHVTARGGELALRRAIGATRSAVVRLVLAEMLLVNLAGAAFAFALGSWMLPLLLAIAPATTRVLGDVTMDWRVALYAMACGAVSSLAAGLLPAWTAAESASALHGATRSTPSKGRQQWRTLLLASQTALCVALLVSGGLLVRALDRASRIAPGFDASHVLTAQLRLPPSRFATPMSRVTAIDQVIARLQAIPGVTHAGATMNRFTPGFAYQTAMAIENQPRPDGSLYTVQFRRVSASYLETLRIRLRRGRNFTDADTLSTLAVALVSQSFADRFWPDQDPLGRRVQRGTAFLTVVGVIDDVSDVDLLQPPEPTLYASWAQTSNAAFPTALVIRTAGDPLAIASTVRSVVASVDPTLAVDRLEPLERFLDDALAPQRFRTTLMIGLAIVGLLLGAIGIAGVTARTIAERMPEFGVRLALGCDSRSLWRLAIVDQLKVVAAGAAAGVALAFGAARMLASLLPETTGADPLVVAGSIALLAATAAVAAAIPASRVLRINPLVILRI
jgi:putative ABC transport system permease protein